MNNMWLATFGDTRLTEARKRIQRQAEDMDIFGDRIRIFSEHDLDADFCEKMKEHLITGSRGFGYWCWKPQVILQAMNEMPDGDVLLYVDIGCHLNPKGLKRLEEYRQYAIEHGIVAFQFRALGDASKFDTSLHFFLERQWTKSDLFRFFNLDKQKAISDTGQVEATVIVIHKNAYSEKIIKSWRECFLNHFELVDDSPSKSPNAPDFIENRHDQSAFSLLCKKYNVFLLSCGEYEHIRYCMPEGGDKRLWPEYWSELKQYPVHAKRDLGKYTKMVECPDWLKPILGKYGRRLASRVYELIKPLINKIKSR